MDLIGGLQAMFSSDFSSSKQRNELHADKSRHTDSDLQKKNSLLKEQLEMAKQQILELEKKLLYVQEVGVDEMKESQNNTSSELLKDIHEKVQQMHNMLARMESNMLSSECLQEQTDSLRTMLDEKTEVFSSKLQEQKEELQVTLDEKTEALYAKLDAREDALQAKLDESNEALQAKLDEREEALQAKFDENNEALQAKIAENSESFRAELVEKVHTENVQCYRNMKGLITDLDVKIEELELGDASLRKIRKSFKGMKFFSFFAFLSFLALLGLWLYDWGYFWLMSFIGN